MKKVSIDGILKICLCLILGTTITIPADAQTLEFIFKPTYYPSVSYEKLSNCKVKPSNNSFWRFFSGCVVKVTTHSGFFVLGDPFPDYEVRLPEKNTDYYTNENQNLYILISDGKKFPVRRFFDNGQICFSGQNSWQFCFKIIE